ncbi:NAD(P)-binding protein [Glaciecola petra]|uniref:NAD(P)/FAD-dependent oxidoreductase n=1 Tax=Glaciecola petra TaxID=3075602 RepID=A0ABU2ZRB2_9ALTE|nr:NAD(P)/FAD-dependent oxidoreductase [Aestuariibacter sp. P117]MDT0594578.1 NAD(P)/FAD-dependent oxidoreductase [Aestuariibacter sp. P117]
MPIKPLADEISADYLIVGAGASGLAFADTLLHESDATMIIVDNRYKPGGHWNDAYPFVTLHQPSAFYGVNSKELSSGELDKVGLNKGLNELATGAEVQAYFENVMNDTLLPSGRVQYLPMCEFDGDKGIKHIPSGKHISVNYSKKRVDGTYYKTAIPATHTPQFKYADNTRLVPPNALPTLVPKAADTIDNYVILGGGKTAIDTCLWLLQNHVSAEQITWFMPRDGWLINRKNAQPTNAFFSDSIGNQACQFEAIAESTSIDDMFVRLEKKGVFMRLDTNVWPEMFHGATVSEDELSCLQAIKNVIRLGRVLNITESSIECVKGNIDAPSNAVFVDCTASAITNLEIEPVFQNDVIKLQTVRAYQPAFSAAFIAHIEVTYDDQDKKNQLTNVVPLPNTLEDWVELTYKNMMNQFFWGKEPGLKKWMINNRLDGFSRLVSQVKFYEISKLKILNRMRLAAKPAIGRLKAYREEIAKGKKV